MTARDAAGRDKNAMQDLIREDARRLAVASCEAQGIPAKITDPVVIGKVASILRSDTPHGRHALGVKAVEATPSRLDRDVVEDRGEDGPPASEGQVAPGVAEG